MTEEEAKTKWCPFANVQGYGNRKGDGAAFSEGSAFPNCIGSACMAWRFVYADATGKRRSGEQPHGYCGLAGKP